MHDSRGRRGRLDVEAILETLEPVPQADAAAEHENLEVVGAAVTGSLALLVDAGHMVTDAGGLLVALIAAHLTLRPPSRRRTWGLLRLEVLAAGAADLLRRAEAMA